MRPISAVGEVSEIPLQFYRLFPSRILRLMTDFTDWVRKMGNGFSLTALTGLTEQTPKNYGFIPSASSTRSCPARVGRQSGPAQTATPPRTHAPKKFPLSVFKSANRSGGTVALAALNLPTSRSVVRTIIGERKDSGRRGASLFRIVRFPDRALPLIRVSTEFRFEVGGAARRWDESNPRPRARFRPHKSPHAWAFA